VSSKVRVAVVGCGAQAQLAHIPALKANPHVELVALCDTDVRKLNQLRTVHNVPRHYLDFDDLREAPEIDAIVIATPNHLHAPMAIAAMRYGKDVLCEMPLGLDAAEAQQIIAVAAQERRKLMPCLVTRLRPDVQTIKKFLDGGELGRPYYCKTGWLRGRGSWSLTGWRGQRLRAGGGAFLSLAPALLDSALWLLAPARPVAVTGVAHRRTAHVDVEDSAFAMVRLTNELLLTIEVSWSMLLEKDFVYFNLFGTAGAALLNPIQIHKEMHGHLVNVTPQIPAHGIQRAAYKLLIDLWVNSLLNDIEPPVSVTDALLISQVADAFYRSSATGTEIPLPPLKSS